MVLDIDTIGVVGDGMAVETRGKVLIARRGVNLSWMSTVDTKDEPGTDFREDLESSRRSCSCGSMVLGC